jgi:hypothetical protein
MAQETFNDAVEINGSQDIPQLTVSGAPDQSQPIQVWQDSNGATLAQLAADGRLELGTTFGGAADALLQVNYSPSDPQPNSAWHAAGTVTSPGTPVNWVHHELDLAGNAGTSSLHTTQYVQLTNNNTAMAGAADLRAATFEAHNLTGTSGTPVGHVTGVQATASNGPAAFAGTLVGVAGALSNDTAGSVSSAAAFAVVPPSNAGTISTLYGLQIPDLTQGVTNYAIYTGQGAVRHGDAVTAESFKLGTPSQLTLSSDAATVTKGYHTIAAQTGTADNLATLSGGAGNMLVLLQAKAGDTITVKHGTGNIFLNGAADFTLSGDKSLLLFYDGTNWADLGAGGGSSGLATVQKSGATVTTNATTLNFADPAANNENPSAGVATVYTNVPSVCNGRLTLASGTAIPTTDQTAKTSIYFTPYQGSQISLYDGTRWKLYNFTELTLTVPSTLFKVFDIFVYDNGGTLTLEAVDWNQSTGSITGATNATPIVLTVASGHGLSVGDLIGVASVGGNTAPNGKVWRVSATAATTVTLEGSVGNGAYTSGGTWYKVPNTRATALTTQDGIYVKTSATTRRYLGTAMTTGTSGQAEDSGSKRYLWNYYNRVQRPMLVIDTTNTWSYSTSAYRATNNRIDNRIQIIVGVSEDLTCAVAIGANNAGSGSAVVFGVGIDTSTANSAQLMSDSSSLGLASGGGTPSSVSTYRGYIATGYHFLQWVEYGRGGIATVVGDNGTTVVQSGLHAEIWG